VETSLLGRNAAWRTTTKRVVGTIVAVTANLWGTVYVTLETGSGDLHTFPAPHVRLEWPPSPSRETFANLPRKTSAKKGKNP